MARPLGDLYITSNFRLQELTCKCCGTLLVNGLLGELVAALQGLRDLINPDPARPPKPVLITSGYRCPKHNVKVGGKPNSWHLQIGRAHV